MMSYTNYASTTLRASAATSGANEQDAAVTLPETVTEFWVVVNKTAEANADNVLSVRIQAQVGSTWFDLGYESMQITGALATAADTATTVTRTPNVVDAYTAAATGTWLAHFREVPSNVVRVASVSSGTTVANTFSVEALYPFNKF